MSTGMILFMVFSAEVLDSSGELVIISGMDISTFEEGLGVCNYEHKSSDDKIASNGEEIVGKILSAKKIYSKSDCSNKQEEDAWEAIKAPMIVGYIRLFDMAGHSGAQALAASIRDQVANNEKVLVRASIEGSTLSKDGNKLTETVARRLALTYKPCLRVCDTALLEDPAAPKGFATKHTKENVKDLLDFEDSNKSEHQDPMYSKLGSIELECNPIVSEESLAKASIGGMGGAAPSTLTGGAALQREEFIKSRALELVKKYSRPEFIKSEFREFAKGHLPTASDEFLNHFADIAEDYHLKRKQIKKSELNLFNLDALDIALRKATSESVEKPFILPEIPEVFQVNVSVNGKFHPAGRFMILHEQLIHLEDYHDSLLQAMLPSGPFDGNMISKINALKLSPYVSIEGHPLPATPSPAVSNNAPILPSVAVSTTPPSVFSYHRVGMDKPHTLEVQNGQYYLLDGSRLSYQEVATIMENIKNGVAKVHYKKSRYASQILKMEQVLEDLMKAESMNPEDALSHISAAVKSGHIHPDVEAALRRHVFEDPMVPGLGNKYAYEQFKSKNKPGAYVGLDAMDFSDINNKYGHGVGDEAIKAYGGAVRDAAAETGGLKAWRTGGDETQVWAPSHEHAARFARTLHSKLEALPPIMGTHKLSAAIGIGHNTETADRAVYAAKEGKYLPGTSHLPARERPKKFTMGTAPTMTHSLYPGHEGPVPHHDLGAEAIHAHVPHSAPTMSAPSPAP